MILQTRKPRAISRSVALPGIVGATLLLSLLTPAAASAAEPSSSSSATSAASSDPTAITPEQLTAVSKEQISTANSGTEKFSSGDLVAQVRDQLDRDRKELERKRAEEAARKKAEEEAKAKAEAEAKAKAEEEAAAKAAAEAEAAAKVAQQAAAQRSSGSSPSTPSSKSASPSAPSYTGGGSKNDWLAASGIPESDWGYVDYIVSRESGWNPNAVNASSGAGGLVQALPCSKVVGGCFDPVSNLKWADGYAKARYGSWAGAYQFWSSNHWW